tara:strand:+ start:69 stop:305 length:237 start_codon:yes stop_codon:yes gene_type:complete
MGQIPGVQDTSEIARQQAMADPLAVAAQYQAQEQMQLQGRGVQQPTYQTGGINPKFNAVAAGVAGDIPARNNSTYDLV